MFNNILTGYDIGIPACNIFQDVKFLRREGKLQPADESFSRIGINPHAPDFYFVFASPVRTADDSLYPRFKLFKIKRLYNVIVGAAVQALRALSNRVARSDNYNGCPQFLFAQKS